MIRHYPVVLLLLSGSAAVFAQSVTLNPTPSKEVGQPKLVAETINPNLVEGRELYTPVGLALDTSTNPPAVYVSDTGNNRVLGWKNAASFSNGKPADLIIGQIDPYSTGTNGSGTASGVSSPTGLAVDKNGNLYVADSGNNRFLRYPKPFAQTSQFPVPDLVLGQPGFNSRTANYTGAVSASGVSLLSGSTPFIVGITLDGNGNVWVVDAGNRRLLEYLASDVANGGQGIGAKAVLGQPDFTTLQTNLNPGTAQASLSTNQFDIPATIAFDAAGRLYVSDSDGVSGGSSRLNRVLVFVPGSGGTFSNGQAATRIMGGGCLSIALNGGQCPAVGSQAASELQNNPAFPYNTLLNDPEGIFFLPPDGGGNQKVGVVDSNFNRILIFPPYGAWPDQASLFSPEASGVIGQSGFGNTFLNPNGNTVASVITPPASATSLYSPHSAAYLSSTNELFIADSRNNRVIVMPSSPTAGSGFGPATRVLGQDRLTTNSTNLIEGKEFFFAANGALGDAGIALDTTGSVPHLYVADPYNHRVMAFYDARKVAPGQKADLIFGQPDGTTALCNYLGGLSSQGGDTNIMTSSSLCSPSDVLVDGAGNLYVADTGNGRVVRFPTPFAACPNGPGSSNCTLTPLPQADLVLGQPNFNSKITDPSNSSMASPYGLAFSGNNGLFVSDLSENRVLFIPFNDTTNHTFRAGSFGLSATKVYGQPDFTTISSGSTLNKLGGPHHISSDSSGQLYVADTGNNRVLIFPDPNNPQTPNAGATANLSLTCANANSNGGCSANLASPRAVYVNSSTGEIWVANSQQSSCVKFPRYSTLIVNPVPTGTVNAFGPLAMTQDQYGDLFVADSANRVAVYYQGAVWQNGASFLTTSALAPNTIATLYPVASSNQFGSNTATFNGTFPMATTLGDVQVLVNGTPSPLYLVSPGQINFIVPENAPTTGNVDVVVQQVSTGQILGAGILPMNTAAPGIFMGQQLAIGSQGYQAAVVNEDGTVNSSTNAAQRGHIVSIYATGQGIIPGMPPDGTQPTGLVSTPQPPQVIIGGCPVDECTSLPGDQPPGQRVQFSGLSPSYPGVWQINVYVPMGTAPGPTVLDLIYNNVPAWSATNTALKTYIYVK
jgi:uncharacterized protein (TIGR03437 family)